MTAAQPQANFREKNVRTAIWLLVAALVVGATAGIAFYAFPGIDISVASLFYEGPRQFLGMTQFLDSVRDALFAAFSAICILALAGLAMTAWKRAPWLSVSYAGWLYLVMCLGIGPGLIGNYALKNNWGRARPTQITEFGGQKSYTPPLTPSYQCSHNCSFVAGEASTVFIVFFACAFLFPRRALTLIAAGIALGSLAGLMRMAQGAHFFSDVVFAGVTMAVTAAALEIVFVYFARRRAGATNAGLKRPLV